MILKSLKKNYQAKRIVKIELIQDPYMHIFFEKGTRGGVSYISNICSKTNNKYLKYYDPKQDSKYIIHLDSNFYGYAMSKFLPASGFKWINPKEFDLNKCTSNSYKRMCSRTRSSIS